VAVKPSLSSLKKKCWKLFSEWIRRKDADEGGTVECYTCGKLMHWTGDGAQAGHAIGGRRNAVLFDHEVVKIQCTYCNSKPPYGLNGNYQVFTTKLIKENGMEWWEAKLVDSRKTVKLTSAEVQEKIEWLKKRIAEL